MQRCRPSTGIWMTLLVLAIASAAYGQDAPSFTIAQVDRASAHYTHGQARRPLRTMDAMFGDGARGEDARISTELPPRRFAPFPSPADRGLHALICRTPTVVSGILLSSIARLDSAGDMIVTLARFRVDDPIKAPPGIAAGTTLTVIREGGEVTDNGIRLRLHAVGRDNFVPGQRYVLMLDPAPGLPAYFDAPFLTIHEVDGRLYPSTDLQGVPAGVSYQGVKARMRDLRATFPCT